MNPNGTPSNLLPFPRGHSGNPGGKPEGARNRLTTAFLNELADHFAEHGADAIKRVCEEKPDKYLAIVASLVPQKVDLTTPLAGLSDEDLTKKLDLLEALSQAIEAQRADHS